MTRLFAISCVLSACMWSIDCTRSEELPADGVFYPALTEQDVSLRRLESTMSSQGIIFVAVDQSRLRRDEPAIIIHNISSRETRYVRQVRMVDARVVQEGDSVRAWVDGEQLLEY